MAVLLNVIFSNCFASKKSGPLRWASRRALPVSMLLASIVSSSLLFAGVAASSVKLPATVLKRP